MKIIHVGKNNEIKTINEAIKASIGPTYIYLDDALYFEKVVIDKEDIILDGQNNATIEYNDYAEKIHEDGRQYVTFRTYTLLIKAKNIYLKNLKILNSAGEGANIGQAVALHLYNDNIVVENCKIIAKQDTLFCGPLSRDLIERYVDLLPLDEREYKNEFHQYFLNCYIEGTVDFIFGGASAVFYNSKIVSGKTSRTCYIAAPNHEKTNNFGFKFIKCKIYSKNHQKENTYLARPWREFGFVSFIDCSLSNNIKKEGFSIWENTNRHENARFYEINSKGKGAKNNKQNRPKWTIVL